MIQLTNPVARAKGGPAVSERRGVRRHTTVFRPVVLESGSFRGLGMVRNIGSGGLMCSVNAPLPVGSPIAVSFGNDKPVCGIIQWAKDGCIGVTFDTPVDVDILLKNANVRHYPGKAQRAPRLEIQCFASLYLDDLPYRVEVVNISQKGVRIECAFARLGQEVRIVVDGLESHKAVVRWTRDGYAGLFFFTPITFETLADWAIRHQLQAGITPEARIMSM